MMRFDPGQLQQYLARLEKKQVNGVLTVSLDLPQPNQSRTVLFALRQGKITYAAAEFMSPTRVVTFIAEKMGTTFLEPALKVVQPRIQKPDSVQEMLTLICQFGLFSWESVETVLQKQIVHALELSLPYGGGMEYDANHAFDMEYPHKIGFSLKELIEPLQERTATWNSLQKSSVGIDAIPVLKEGAQSSIESDEIRAHLSQWADGQNSLGSIALAVQKDPLELAKRYLQFSRKGWINLEGDSPASSNVAPRSATSTDSLPIVLSVDDSPVVQTVIKRSICDRYQVLLANNAVDALNMLNSHPVALLLLDVTMPDIDGLELCKTIRSISKFRDLPVVMLTAKDGLIDKVKGQFAGSTHYLTKPIERDKLLAVLEKYIPQAITA